MKLNQLHIFVCASRHLNLSDTAAELGMSQPAVSLQMKKLQDEFGVDLYRASNRGIELTREGRDFAAAVQPLIEKLSLIERQLKLSANDTRAKQLTIGATHTLTETVLLERVVQFRKRHPDVRFVMETAGSPKIEKSVRNGQIDIGLISGPSYFPECEYEEFCDQEIVAFVPAGHRLAGSILTLADLMGEPLVTKKDGTCVKRLFGLGFNPNIALECVAADGIKSAVMKGLGIGLLFRARIKDSLDRKDFGLIRIPELRKLSRKSFIVFPKSNGLTKAGKSFLSSLRKQV